MTSSTVVPESVANDAMLTWYRGEFAAANAIIDALCAHLAQLGEGGDCYDGVFRAVHCRRMNWIPVLQMQKFYSIADVSNELRRATAARLEARREVEARRKVSTKLAAIEEEAVEEEKTAEVVAAATEKAAVEEEEVVDEFAVKIVKEEALGDKETVEIVASATEKPAVEEEEVVDEDAVKIVVEVAATKKAAVEEEEVVDEIVVKIADEEAATEKVAVEEEAVVDEVAAAVEEEVEMTSEEYSGELLDQKLEDESTTTHESQEPHSPLECAQVCSNHKDCLARSERIKLLKGFMAKEAVKGHMVNIVKGLKVYEDIFIDSELAKLSEYISELRQSGCNGELAGETFILFNKQMKGNKREIIQLGVPLFQPTNEESTSTIEQIPPVLESIIDHLVQWRLLPETRRPNSCILNFFDEDEHSQPYFKPPHLDNPISTLVLTETKMAFGRALSCDANGNYKGSLTLEVKQGSLLVMRGNSADMARHVICPSSNSRVTITFLKVRTSQVESPKTPLPSKAMTLWQPGTPQVQKLPTPGFIAYAPQPMVQTTWGLAFRAPVVMLTPPRTMVMSPPPSKPVTPNGTGVFLPWTASPKKHTKHLPPRMQKRRQLASLPALEAKA